MPPTDPIAQPLPGNTTDLVGRGDIGQERVIEDLSATVADLGQDEEQHPGKNIALLHEEEQGSENPGKGCKHEQDALLGCREIRDRPRTGEITATTSMAIPSEKPHNREPSAPPTTAPLKYAEYTASSMTAA